MKKPLTALIRTSPDRCYNTKRYRPDTNKGSETKSNFKNCPQAKIVMKTMLGLTASVYNPINNPSLATPSSSTPASSPSASVNRVASVLDTSNISAISDITGTNLKSEDVDPPNSNAERTLTNASVIEVENVSTFSPPTTRASFLPDIRKTNKTVQPAVHSNGAPKIKPKMKHRLTKQPIVPVHKYVENFTSSSEDDDIEIIENPMKEIHMSQSTSEDFLRVGSTEGEVAVGIFWDIENVRMPRGLNPAIFITKLREKFVDESSKFCEKHFYVVCDAREESHLIMKQLFEFHVRIIHVPRLKANSSDNVIRDLMHEFVGYNKYCRLILISGDCDFSHDIHNFRRNKKCECILIHNQIAKESLIRSATSAYLYTDLIKNEILAAHTNQLSENKRKNPKYFNRYPSPNYPVNQAHHPNHKKAKGKQKIHPGIFHQERFYNQELSDNVNVPVVNGENAIILANDENGQSCSHVGKLDESLPDYIPLSTSGTALSKAYYRKKIKQVRSHRKVSRKRKAKQVLGSNISLRDY